MYQNKVVVALKVNSRILRESQGVVHIPFGSEYSVFVKNLNAVRAKFQLAIDGTDATSGSWIVVPANSSVEMERFISNGDWNRGRRFKFIERTAEIEAHRGVKSDDGLVRVEFQVEQLRPIVNVPRYVEYDVPVPRPYYPPYDPWYPHPWPRRPFLGSAMRSSGGRKGSSGSGSASVSAGTWCSASLGNEAGSAISDSAPTTDVGITVQGSESHQRFVNAEWFETGPSDVIVLQLRGELAGQAISAPITVTTKLTCPTCGSSQKHGEFCQRCGTALVA